MSPTTRWEVLMLTLSAVHAAALLYSPSVPVIAIGLWWNSNTIAHNFVHRPFFRSRAANLAFGAYLSLLLGVPQSLWRDRHLAHHGGVRPRIRWSGELFLQVALVVGLCIALVLTARDFLLSTYLPAYVAGLCLCALHGYFEHAGGTTSYYGKLYNALFFNDGYHAEHHANPAIHWTQLPDHVQPETLVSAWPAPFRWLRVFSLESLERLTLRSATLRKLVSAKHRRAITAVAPQLSRVASIVIVGGGLCPRSAVILKQLLPSADITILDANRANLEEARRFLATAAGSIGFLHAWYTPAMRISCDLLVIPLSFAGDRDAIYAKPPAPAVLVHDWIWRKRGESRIVSVLFLKRINLLRP
jgi:hypothetical protein